MNRYQDTALSSQARAQDLLERMSLQEKIAQLGGLYVYQVLTDFQFRADKAEKLLTHGIGQITRLGGGTNLNPADAAVLGNRIQRFLVENTRLGIPAIIHEEACAGYLTRNSDVFPQTIGMGATFNPELTLKMGTLIREQMMALGARQALAPLMDITRDARWGRTEETYGEDPYLTARMGVNYIKGLQGDDLAHGVAATGKHFMGYGASEGGMNWAPVRLASREMEEVYLYPFEAAVKEAGLKSVMPAYNELDGVPCHSHEWLLQDLLRSKWGFDGIVVSDYCGIEQIHSYHKAAASKRDAARMALEAGVDVELPDVDCYGDILIQAVADGSIPEALIDTSALRILKMKFDLGLFENPYCDETAAGSHFHTPAQRAYALDAARQSMVLLKNDGLLPLQNPTSLALIGPNADSVRNMLGDYSYPAHIEALLDQIAGAGVPTSVPEGKLTLDGVLPQMRSIRQELADRLPRCVVRYAKGCNVNDQDISGFEEAVSTAKTSDVAVLVLGDQSGLTLAATSGEGRDRMGLNLPGKQLDLLKAVYATGTPVVLVLLTGRPVSLCWEQEHIPAILEAWMPGQEGAQAIWDVLLGEYNPAGRLPISFPRDVGQVPVYYAHKPSGQRSHWMTDYVEGPTTPLYPFGFGLSYTRFDYSDLRIEQEQLPSDGQLRLSFTVQNTGGSAGDEVAQVYLHDLLSDVTRPVKELKAFVRLSLKPGDRKRVSVVISTDQMGFYNRAMRYVVEPGQMEVLIGASSEDIRLKGDFTITGPLREVQNKRFSSDITVA